jgi:hypothetical protein
VREKLGIVFELPEVTREQLRVNPGEGLEALSDAALRRVIGSDPLGEIEPANTAIAACRREVNEAFHAVSRVLAEADQRFRRTAEKVNRIDLERVRLAKAVLAKREEARQRAKEEGARQSEGMMVGSGA